MNNWGSRLVASANIESDVLFVTRRKTGAVFNKILIIANILLRASRQRFVQLPSLDSILNSQVPEL